MLLDKDEMVAPGFPVGKKAGLVLPHEELGLCTNCDQPRTLDELFDKEPEADPAAIFLLCACGLGTDCESVNEDNGKSSASESSDEPERLEQSEIVLEVAMPDDSRSVVAIAEENPVEFERKLKPYRRRKRSDRLRLYSPPSRRVRTS